MFFHKLKEARIENFESENPVNFNLSDITWFDWDELLFVQGDDSSWTDAEEIEEEIFQKTKRKFKAIDLEVCYHRFYFLKDKKVVFHRNIFGYGDILIDLWRCDRDKFMNWLTKDQCNFKVVPSSKGNYFLFLIPTCRKVPERLLNTNEI